MPTQPEVSMAQAYGGAAQGMFRQSGVFYDKQRLQNRIKTPASIPGGRASIEALASSVSGFNLAHHPHLATAYLSKEEILPKHCFANFRI